MPVRLGINGFGRIGRQVTKVIMQRYTTKIEIVAINDLTDNKALAHLLKYDSIYGRFPGTVEVGDEGLIINGKSIKCFEERDPAKLPWQDLGVDVVLESTGHFTSTDKAGAHLKAGAKKVIISAPAKKSKGGCEYDDKLVTIVLGVNDEDYIPSQHDIISNASCTTNCLAPMVKVLNDAFTIESGFMTTVHSYTNDQRILDFPHEDFRRMRAAALNIIPTKTGAAAAIGEVVKECNKKLDGFALRVPTPTGSVTDLTVSLEKPATKQAINDAFRAAASSGPMAPYLDYTEEPIVLADIVGSPASCIVDGLETRVQGKLAKVLGWYDNEWGYSNRTADLIIMLDKNGL
ncbi:MAG: type I glyceraldehyde-3-phosphate dehydrogenase [Candidatus Zipacnadales bacterium]